MKKVMLIAIVASTVIFGCSKEETNEDTHQVGTPQTTEYIPLVIGNYWVYDTYIIDTLGNETAYSLSDSVYIGRDTTINNKTYYILEGNSNAKNAIGLGSFIRNEKNSIYSFMSGEDKLLFTINNLGAVYDTDSISSFLTSSTKTLPTETSITVPIGTFFCYEQEVTYTPVSNNYPWGIRIQRKHFNSNVGVIKSQYFYFSSSDYFEARLIRYNIN